MNCPNKNLSEWKALESALGEDQAYRAWIRNNGEYPTPMEAVYQLFIDHNNELGGTLLTKHVNQKEIQEVKSVLETLKLADPSLYQEGEFTNWAKSQPFGNKLEFNSQKRQITIQDISSLGKLEGEKESIETVGLGSNTRQLLQIMGSSMYNSPVAQVAIKELLQNSFDATKARQNLTENKSPGQIRISINIKDRTISIRDNGIGMSPDIVKNAFLYIGGTNKEGLGVGERSGGFGVAKVQFLMASEEIVVETIKDGVKTTLTTNPEELLEGKTKLHTEKTNAPNGTFVSIKIPENYTTIEGVKRSIDFPGRYSGYKEYNILKKPLIGNIEVKVKVINTSNEETIDVLPVGININTEILPPLLTNVKFNWGNAEVYLSENKVENPVHQILSSGIYQFDHDFRDSGWNSIPYNIVVNIKPTVIAASDQYPFDIKREGFKNTISEDIKSLNNYLLRYASGEAETEAKANFKNIIALPTVDPNKVLTPEEKEKLTKIVDERLKEIGSESNKIEKTQRVVTYIEVSKGVVTNTETGEIESNEKEWESSFKAQKDIEEVLPLDISDFNDKSPQFHNNTNVDYLKTPGAVEFFTDFGNVVHQIVKEFGGDYLPNKHSSGYNRLKGKNIELNRESYFAGISIDKGYHGLHTYSPFKAVFINPLSYDTDSVEDLTYKYLMTIIHEIVHTTQPNHDYNKFGRELQDVIGIFFASPRADLYAGLLRSTFKKHSQTYNTLIKEYGKSTTKNLSKSFEGQEDKTDPSQINDGSRINSEKRGENGFRNDTGSETSSELSKKDKLGDVIASKLSKNKKIINVPASETQNKKEGLDFIFESNPNLAKVGTQEQYSAWINYLITQGKFKGTQATEILSHGTDQKFETFDKSKRGTATGVGNFKDEEKTPLDSMNAFFFSTDPTVSQQYGLIRRVNQIENIATILGYGLVSPQRFKEIRKYSPELADHLNQKAKEVSPEDLKQYIKDLYIKYDNISRDLGVGFLNSYNNYVRFGKQIKDLQNRKQEILSGEYIHNSMSPAHPTISIAIYDTKGYSETNIRDTGKITSSYSEFDKKNIKDLSSEQFDKLLNTAQASYDSGTNKLNSLMTKAKITPIVYSAILNIQKPLVKDFEGMPFVNQAYSNGAQYEASKLTNQAVKSGTYDGVIFKNIKDPYLSDNYGVFEPEQIHILGGKQDIEGFKDFVEGESTVEFRNELTPDLPVFNVEEQNKVHAEEIVSNVLEQFSDRLNIPYEKVSPEQARTILEKTNTPYGGQASFFFNGINYQVNGKFTPLSAVHEFAHPLLKAIAKENPKLFQNLFNQVGTTPEMEDLESKVKTAYPKLDPLSDRFKEEVIVHAIEKDATNKALGKTNSKGFTDFITNLWYSVKQLLRKLFGKKINISKLNTNTTLSELATMLAGDKMNLQTYNITNQDFADFRNDLDKFYKDLEKYKEGNKAQQTVNLMYEMMNKQMNMINKNPKAFEDIKKFLVDEEGKGLVKDIRNTLQSFQTLNQSDVEAAKKFRAQVNFKKQEANAIIDSLDSLGFIANKVHENLKEIDTEGSDPSRETLMKVVHYGYLTDYWTKFIIETIKEMDDAGISPTSELAKLLSNAKTTIDAANRKANSIKKKFAGSFVEAQVQAMKEVIDNDYTAALAKLKAKNAPQNEIDKLTKEYNRLKLDRTKIDDILSGKGVDMNWANAMFESYSMAHDPIIGGVAMFIKNTLADIDIAVQQKSNDLMRTLEPLLVANNYSPTDTQKLGKEVTFEDTVASREKDEDGNEYVVQTKVRTYLNPFKNYRYDKGVLWDNLQKAIIKGDEQEIAEAQRLYNQLEKDYFNRDKTSEFYAIEDKYKNSDKTYTDSDGKQVNIAHEAFAERSSILNEIQQVNPHTALEIDVYKNYDVTKQLWRDYSQLYSLTDIDGKPKTGIELEKAKLLRDYRTATRDMYEWKERPGAFEEALSNFESQLEASGVTPEEFKTQVDEWIVKNTKRTYDQSWYQERTKAIETLQRIFAKLDRDERTSLDITESWGKILDTVAGFRDEEGQPVASDMSVTRIDTVRKNQQIIEDAKYKLAGLSGMSPEEMDRINTYFSKRKAKIDLTIEEEDDFEELLAKKEEGKLNGLDEFDKAQLLAAFASLAELQEKLPTDYYLDRINYWTRELNQPAIDEKNAGDILSGEALAPLFKKSPEFEEWFKKNHIKRMIFDKATKTKKEQWERLYVWSVVQPKDEKYVKKTTLKRIDPLTGKPMVIIGVPGIKYQYKQLNAKYRTKKVLGETVDINGQWLPKTLAQGAKDDKYINKEYYDLEKTNPSRFKLINTLRDAHLNIQKGLPYASRLGNDIPRYRKQNLEYAQTATAKSILTAWRDSIKAAKDDFEAGLNYEQKNQLSLVRADLFDEEIDTIPITGTSKIDIDQTSLDILYGMHRYLYSAERQKKLLEINPMVKAIRDTLNNKENGPKDIYKANKSKQLLTGVTEFLGKKGPYIRASALNALYEREFLGKTVTGFSENSPGLNKIVSFLMGKASFSFFAFNIPSAIKNMFGGMFQNMIETAGGEYVNAVSMAKGTASATKAVVKLQNDIYTRGPKSLEYQMTEIFDFVQGRFEESIGKSSSRTFASDAASLSWFMSARKLMEIESTLQLSYGIMHNIFVEQTLPDGSKRKLEYADAWELKNGQISLKEGIDKTYDKGGDFFLRTRNLIHAKNEQMQGSFSKFSQPDAQRYLAFRLLSYMRRYFTSMFINRFGKNRYNWGETTVREGYYLTGMRATLEIIKSMGQHLKYLSPRERVAYVKFLTEISALIVLSATMGLLFGYDPDDPDRFAKLRAKSGALGSDDFELQGWLSNHTLNMVMQVRNENETFIPWPGFGLDDYLQLKDVTSIAFGATLNTYGEIVVDVLNTIKQDPSAYYKQDIGIYPWQKKGSNKTLQDIAKMFGITSGSMDPVGTIRRFEGAKSKYK